MPDDVPVAPRVDDAANTETIKNLKPPDMIADASQFPLYEKRLKRWSRLSSSLSLQTQFDVILSSVPINNPLCEKLEEEIGDSTQAKDKGIEVILDKLREWFGKEEDIDAFVNYKEFECKARENNQDLLEFVNEWESLYNKCKAREDTISDLVLAFKLIVSCRLTEMDHKLVFREAKSKEKDGKVFDRTKQAIRMFYNAGTLKTFTEAKTLISDKFDDENMDDPVIKSLLEKGWKAPKGKTSQGQGYHPYKKWFKCKHCLCSCEPRDKRCDCPCSKHRAQNCPQKPESETPRSSSQTPLLYSKLGSKIGINKCLLVSNSEDKLQQNNVQSLTKYLYSPSNDNLELYCPKNAGSETK